MRYVLSILFLLVLINHAVHASTPCLKKLKSEAKKNWSLSPSKEYYKAGRFVSEFDSTYKECVIGLSLKQVKKIFGKPTKIKEKPMQYVFLITPPMGEGHLYCSELYFTFNSKLVVVRTDIISSQGDFSH